MEWYEIVLVLIVLVAAGVLFGNPGDKRNWKLY